MEKIAYLYLKTHNVTSLRYLGKTIQNPHKYNGSGQRWINHLNKHGYDISTKILFQTRDMKEFKVVSTFYSKLLNIVMNPKYANLYEETGCGGDTSKTPNFLKALKLKNEAFKNGTYIPKDRGTKKPRSKESIEKQRKTIMGVKKGPYKNYNYNASAKEVLIHDIS